MEKNFDNIYDKILQDIGSNFEKKFEVKKYIILLFFSIIIAIILYNIFDITFALAFLVISEFIILYFFMKLQDNKIHSYKNIIVSKLIKEIDSDFLYTYKSDITEYNYRQSKFSDKFDEFISIDQVSGKLKTGNNIKFSRVVTKKIERKLNNGSIKTQKIEIFNGIFGIVNLEKMIPIDMTITSNDFKQKYNSKRIEIDSEKFEKRFDCFSDNKIVTLQVLTPEIIDGLNNVYDIIKKPIQIRINGNIIYFRFFCENFFVPSRVKKMLDKDRLKMLYNQIDCICNTFNNICENINNNI